MAHKKKDHKRVLIVEDEMITALHMRRLVTQMGHEVVGMVMSGEDAITMVQADLADLIFMDTRLRGELSGYDAACAIWTEREIPIVFFCGDHFLQDAHAEIARTHTVVKKPFTDCDVINAIARLT
jgi:CheY-like chemotaxis protein